jgi:CARDB protein/copper-binding protein NosD
VALRLLRLAAMISPRTCLRACVVVLLGSTVLLGSPLRAQAAPLRTFYVAPTGNDAGAGSSASPWRTLQKAANTVRAGDLVIIRAGTYAGFDLWTSGTAANPIAFSAEPGVVVNAPNPRTGDGINLEGASHVVIEGFTLDGLPRAGIRAVLNQHVTIRHNTADLNGRWGIFTGFSDDLLIENNVTSRSQLEHGIYVSNSGDRPVIRGNVSWGNHANGIHMNGDEGQGGDGVIANALVEGNVIYENGRGGGSGINCDGVRDSRIQNNLLFDNHASGISLYRIDGGDGSRNNVVSHNTIVQAADARWAINIRDGSTGNTLYNNILYNQHPWRGSISLSQDSRAGFTSDSNVVMGRFTLDDGNSVLTLAQWRAATGQDLHSIVATPAQLFVDPAADDYHLRDDSPARDAGLTLPEVTVDVEGTPRPGGPVSDIGAYEIAVSAPVPPAQPDLVATSVSNPPSRVRRRGTLSVTDVVGNQGTGTAAASIARYYLSVDAVRSAGDQLLTGDRAVPSLAPGAQSAGTVSVKVPVTMATGSYFLLVCADDRNLVAESNEGNNCVASATQVSVTR